MLIIDANCANETLSTTSSADFAPIKKAILEGKALMVMGGKKLRDEYQLLSKDTWRFIVALDKAGKAVSCSDGDVDAIQEQLEASGLLKSDDPHIIALAQVSGARLLCSKDQNLHKDFLSSKLISDPRGNVYQSATHARLIRKCCKG